LRRRNRGRILGDFTIYAANERYELLIPTNRSSLALVWFNYGFFPMEGPAGYEWRWLNHHGHMAVVSGCKQTLKLRSNLQVNPQLADTRLDITLNGREIMRQEIKGWHMLDLDVPVEAGPNTISFLGLKPGVPIPGEDARPVGIRFWTPRAEIVRTLETVQVPEKATLSSRGSAAVQTP
jgi:hypothetical protein